MRDNGRDARLALLAGRQAGAFSFAQALGLGFPSSTIGDRLRSGTWDRRLPGVFTIGGSAVTRLTELWVAALAVGPRAVLTHETSALCHGAEGLPTRPIVLTVPHRWHHRLPGIFVHQIDDLVPSHCTRWGGLSVSHPARAIVELGATQTEATIGRVTDDLLRLRRTTVAEVSRVLADVARPGKPGIRKLAAVIDQRRPGFVPPHSELERLLFDVLAAGGLPAPARQIPLPGRGRVRGIADGGYLDAKIILEADGRSWHDRLHASRNDKARDLQVMRAGWLPMRFVHEMLTSDPAEVCAIVAETRQQRLELLRLAA
jgi:hypothetical protein